MDCPNPDTVQLILRCALQFDFSESGYLSLTHYTIRFSSAGCYLRLCPLRSLANDPDGFAVLSPCVPQELEAAGLEGWRELGVHHAPPERHLVEQRVGHTHLGATTIRLLFSFSIATGSSFRPAPISHPLYHSLPHCRQEAMTMDRRISMSRT